MVVCCCACVRVRVRGCISDSRPSSVTHFRRWCTPHALNRAIAYALGCTVDGDEGKEGGGEDEEGGDAAAAAAGAAAAVSVGGRRRWRASPSGIWSGNQLLQEIRKVVKSIDLSLPQRVRFARVGA